MTQKRDDAIERMLRMMNGDTRAGEPSLCLDPETLAAWADGHLSGSARATAEAHAASCARCQGMLAAMARTADVAADGAAGTERSRTWVQRMLPWMAPLGAAAAAALLWVAILPRVESPRESAPPVSVAAEPKAAPDAGARETDAAASARVSELERQAPADRAPLRDTFKRQDAQQKADAPKDSEHTRARKQSLDEVQQNARPSAGVPPLPSTPPPASASPMPVVTPPATEERLATQEQRREGQAAGRGGFADARAVSTLKSAIEAPPIRITSPDPKGLWRITGGLVERSSDAGKTWGDPTFIGHVQFAGGSAPSPSVCWIVGTSGIVLRTVDGRKWELASFPETIDLVAVTATSADAATVTTADGRAFTTSDGGKTWHLKR